MNIQSDMITQMRDESENDEKNKYFFCQGVLYASGHAGHFYIVYTSLKSLNHLVRLTGI